MYKTHTELPTRLDHYYHQVKTIILARQNPITGLLPASTAVNAHGDYTDAWVRDNVYSILAVWGLALAYRKLDEDKGRTYELEHSVIKLMRGLLYAMMRQAQKVERFKYTQALEDSLHAKYNTQTGDIVVGDHEWGHLQVDATSLWVLMLAQMTASGLEIVGTIDEVNFVQNLVHYIGRAYRTPDYGIWERGDKINRGKAELNASSIGMAKAALEAINKLDLFGVRGSQASVIHVLPDEIARARITLQNLLPRESSSKEIDAALLSAITFPAFAVEDVQLIERTKSEIINKLQGQYGCKRFLRDGHQTVLENPMCLHYEPWELQQFENVECEWPLFFTYLLLDGIFRGDPEQARDYQERLESLLIERDGLRLLPEIYYVPLENIKAEKSVPHSQPRLPNENIPLVWAQGLYLLGLMLKEGLLSIGDIDPLGRRLCVGRQREVIVQIALLAEDEDLQAKLEVHGIETQTPKQLEPIQVRHAEELSAAYTQIGRNDKLGLTGRPARRLRSLTTSRIYRIRGETMVFLPALLDPQQFYLTLDHYFMVEEIKSELAYIREHWDQLGRPTVTLMLTHRMLETDSEALLALMQELKDGHCESIKVRLGRLKQLMLTAGTERIDFLHGFQFSQESIKDAEPRRYYLASKPEKNRHLNYAQEFNIESETQVEVLLSRLRMSENLYEQIQLLQTLTRIWGLEFETGFGDPGQPVTVADLLDEVYTKAGQLSYWEVIRQVAGLRQMVDLSLSDHVTNLLVRGKQIAVGKSYSEAALITSPLPNNQIMDKIQEFCLEDIRDRVLTQEILIYLGILIKLEPQLFQGLLTVRVGYLILLITSELAQELNVTQDQAYQHLMALAPSEVERRLRRVMAGYAGMGRLLRQQESLSVKQKVSEIDWRVQAAENHAELPAEGWLRHRQKLGSMNRVPKDFFQRIWRLLKHCQGLVIGEKLDPRNRLISEVLLAQMTAGEKNFALRVEHLLNKIPAPEYRQVNVETLIALAALTEHNPELQIEEHIVLDVVIGHAVRLAWLERFPEQADSYDEYKAAAWRSFYNTSFRESSDFIVKAFRFLTEPEQASIAELV